jgi:hypothetical protein
VSKVHLIFGKPSEIAAEASRREGRLEAELDDFQEKIKKIAQFGKELLPLQPEILGFTKKKGQQRTTKTSI